MSASNTTILIKRSQSTSTPATLTPGELAYSYASNALFIGSDTGAPLNIGGVSTLIKLQAAFDKANTGGSSVGLDSAYGHANAAYDQANTATSDASAAQSTADAAYGQANTATSDASTAWNYADAAYGQANTATSDAFTAQTTADAAYGQANTATSDAFTAQTTADAAYGQANTATTLGQAAFDAANNVVSSFTIDGDSGSDTFYTGETLTFTGGDGVTTAITDNQVTIDVDDTVIRTSGGQTIGGSLAITGDLIVSGNTVTQDVNTITIEDSLIQLAANNNVSDALDIGFFGEYVNSGLKYTTLMRDASDGKYKLLVGGTEKPSAGNTVNVAAFSTGTLVADIEAGAISTGTLTATGLANLATPQTTSALMYVDSSTGEVVYSFVVDGGVF